MKASTGWRHTLAGVATVALLVGVTACSSAGTSSSSGTATAKPVKTIASGLTFSLNPGGITNISEYVGMDMGYFAKNGIVNSKPVSSTSGATTLQLLQANQLDFGAINVPSTILAQQTSGVPLRVAVGLMTKFPASLVCNKKVTIKGQYPKNLASLKGLKVGTDSPSGSSNTYLNVTLQQNGIDPASVPRVFIAGGVAPLTAALTTGAIDCAVVFEPTQTVLGNTVNTVWDVESNKVPKVLQEARYNVLSVTKAFADNNPKVITAVQKAMVEIDNFLADPKNAKKAAEGVASRYPDFTVAELTKVIARMAPAFVDGANITKAQYAACIKVFNIANNQNIAIPYNDVILPLAK